MDILKFNTSKKSGIFKRMNAVCNGPIHKRIPTTQVRSNFQTYKEARIPFARNHDAAFCSAYGGEHVVDITAIFPNFDADPYTPESYDFTLTDEYILVTLEAGTETFYRLGQKIENHIKKYNIYPPKDFKKWAVICEHIIRHYNEGWADGYHFNIQYWEIWGEPDLDPDDSPNKRIWGGTTAQFYDLYEIASKHLKSCFPNIKIGGPGFAHEMDFAANFMAEMRRREVPIDFCSWHQYATKPQSVVRRGETIRRILDENGYTAAENILDEWNYVSNWKEHFVESIETIIGMKGAAFTASVMAKCQNAPLDMLMYYDARPCIFNGLFDFYTLLPLKGYYPFVMWNELYKLSSQAEAVSDDPALDVICATDGRNTRALLTYYSMDEAADAKEVTVSGEGTYEVYLLDADHTYEMTETVTLPATLTMQANSVILLKKA